MGLFDNGQTQVERLGIDRLVAREAVLHLNDGETSIRGFVLEFYPDAIRVAKPKLLLADQPQSDLGGEALVFHDQIKFVQLLGG